MGYEYLSDASSPNPSSSTEMTPNTSLKPASANGETTTSVCVFSNNNKLSEKFQSSSSLSLSQVITLTELKPLQLIEIISQLKQGKKLEQILQRIAAPVIQRVEKALTDQYATLNATEAIADRGDPSLDLTIDALISKMCSSSTSFRSTDEIHQIASATPLRITFEERMLLRLLEQTLDASEYTNKVDSSGTWSEVKRRSHQIKHVCSVLSGLIVAYQYELGQKLISEHEYKENAAFFQNVFEVGRRYKILNPERMRDSYGKLMYFLMDARAHSSDLEFDCIVPIKTVWSLLSKKQNGFQLLKDPLVRLASAEIMPEGKVRKQIQWEIEQKERAVKTLTHRYATTKQLNSTIFSRFTTSFFSRPTPDDENSSNSSIVQDSKEEQEYEDLTVEEIELCLYSLGDRNTFLRFNCEPCDKIIAHLQKYFHPKHYEPEFSLVITAGENDSRLSHSHERQYNYVLQSLTFWREVLHDMLGLWSLAEIDLLSSSNPYTLKDSGQGLHRVQNAPHIYRSMYRILTRVQEKVGGWYGSSEIHLGDHNVPNALLFIDKYLQVPRILGPIVLCLEKIPELTVSTPAMKNYIEKSFGSEQLLIKTILADFFRHGFDGSGADNFYDAGSCIDGRLTSAWNWCSKIETKPYFPIFLLTGFSGFDGRF